MMKNLALFASMKAMDQKQDMYGSFWKYISQTQKDLILEGEYLMNDVIRHGSYRFKDYSFIVFPFAKAYEGFLKQLFRDIKFISHLDYISDHLRLGKLMSPNMIDKLADRSLYKKMRDTVTVDFANRVWETWTVGRNKIFHYYPHNLKSITFEEAERIVDQIIQTMEEAYVNLKSNVKAQIPNS